MDLVVIGINHKTAPLQIREKFAFSPEQVAQFLITAQAYNSCPERSKNNLQGQVLLSTCNRTELYAAVIKDISSRAEVEKQILDLFDQVKNCDLMKSRLSTPDGQYHNIFWGKEAVNQLFKVAAGLDSMILGEPQILGQLKAAYHISCNCRTSSYLINKLFHQAFRVGKKVRSETKIGEGSVSIAAAAVKVAEEMLTNFKNKKALLIGAGEIGTLTAHHLVSRGLEKFYICSRSNTGAENLAQNLAGIACGATAEVINFEFLNKVIAEVDIIISSTNSQSCVLTYEQMKKVLPNRSSSTAGSSGTAGNNKPLLIIDLAVPHDVDPAVAELKLVTLLNIDKLGQLVEDNLEKRFSQIEKAEKIIQKEVISFQNWLNSLSVEPSIKKLIEKVENIRSQELSQFIKKLNGNLNNSLFACGATAINEQAKITCGATADLDPEIQKLLDQMTKRLVKKILHTPFHQIRKMSPLQSQDLAKIDAFLDLFDLKKN